MEEVSQRVDRLDKQNGPPPQQRLATKFQTAGTTKWQTSLYPAGWTRTTTKRQRGLMIPPRRDTVSLSKDNASLVASAFTSVLSNQERKESFPCPAVKETRCPRLDSMFETAIHKDVKSADTEIARIQALINDPLTHLLHSVESVSAEEALRISDQLLGNASANMS